MAAGQIGPAEVVGLELMAVLGRASDAAGKYAVWVARERAKGSLCQRGRARGPAAKWAGENGNRHLERRGRAVVSPILFDCWPVRLRHAGIQIYGGKN